MEIFCMTSSVLFFWKVDSLNNQKEDLKAQLDNARTQLRKYKEDFNKLVWG